MSMAPDPLRQLHVFWHDGHPLGVDSTEVGVLKEADNVSLHPLLQGGERGNLDAEGVNVLLHKTPGQSLERDVEKYSCQIFQVKIKTGKATS